ncbi:ATP-binding protein [Desulfobacula sp.]|uniref:hybrid sensor histidine kinase/response regulator n=1 Tax=Desulfobacula sp. TaxID=2593537 RepID=UPI0025C6400D|nr:ATP-binding protein [Desulfobacula sp.]MBC2703645.1 PAS domain S-box protein [Desulfobacula sp.]
MAKIEIDIEEIEKNFFKRGNSLKKLLKASLDLFEARHTGILYGTNQTKLKFLPTSMWDRGIMDKFDGRGIKGLILKIFGSSIVTARKLSPVFFFKTDQNGEVKDNDGIISYVLRNCADYYKKGIGVIICPDTDKYVYKKSEKYLQIPFFSYAGNGIEKSEDTILVDTRIVKHFNSSNSIYIYLPDYGILVINTADVALLETKGSKFIREKELTQRLDVLIKLVNTSSLASLGQLKGEKGSQLLWRKERHLRKTSLELIENEKKYRDLYENAPVAYFSMDNQGIIIKCNYTTSKLSGYEKEELTGRYVMEFSVYDGGLIPDQVWAIFAQGESVRDVEMKFKHKNQGNIWISLSLDAIRDKDGDIFEIRATAIDISKRKALEKQLLQAQKMEAIGTFAGGIAHDFNDIIAPVSGYTEMLLMDTREGDPEIKYLDIILECAKHAKGLVNQILTFSRQKEHDLKPLSIGDAVRESVILVRAFLPATIKVNTNIDKTCRYILADPVQIHQVIMNLVTNAYHAMQEKGGTLDISLKVEKNLEQIFSELAAEVREYVRLTIKDTGTGIDPDIFNKIFDPYFSTKKEGKGSGIGLSVVHGIVENHDGYIRVESSKEKGTCFDIYFPMCQKCLDVEQADPEEISIQAGTERILLVDDDKKVAVMGTQMLEKLGYTVTCFTSSLDALTVFRSNPDMFDAIVTDLIMPDLTGDQLAGKIYDIRPDVPVILCTGFGDTVDRHRLESPSIKGFLKKPVPIKELSYALRQILDKN